MNYFFLFLTIWLIYGVLQNLLIGLRVRSNIPTVSQKTTNSQ